jgi:aryl-alcohol dehydrogenase-like predicted oxidoreductase
MKDKLSLETYRLLGRSGLRISPLSLGTMTFGSPGRLGMERDEAHRIFSTYVERGGNFVDTANQYNYGEAERLIGEFSDKERDRLVIATKYTLPMQAADPNSGGNHRKSMVQSVESSLRRLGTEYIDLLYLHAWDATSPVEEILRGMDDLVRSGKVLYIGISNTVAWQVSRMQAIADLRGWTPLVALQIEYNLIERGAERDLVPMGVEMGLGVIPWAPLAGGVLTGKYDHADLSSAGNTTVFENSRIEYAVMSGELSARSLAIVDVVKAIAGELECSPAQIALAWILQCSGITAPIIGVRTVKQLCENLAALDIELDKSQMKRLNDASTIKLGYPHDYLSLLEKSSDMSARYRRVR